MTASSVASSAVSRLRRIERTVIAEARELLRRAPSDDDGMIRASDSARLATLGAVRSQVISLLREQGRDPAILQTDRAIVDAMNDAESKAPRITADDGRVVQADFNVRQRARIQQATEGTIDAVAAAFDSAQDEIRAAIDAVANAPVSLRRFILSVSDRMSVAFSHAATAIETAVFAAHRASLITLAERASEETGVEIAYLYDGPKDRKNRPFCRRHLGKAYTLEALRELDNGQDLDVEHYAGGWNCRHRLSPVPIDILEDEGIEVIRG